MDILASSCDGSGINLTNCSTPSPSGNNFLLTSCQSAQTFSVSHSNASSGDNITIEGNVWKDEFVKNILIKIN